MAGFNVMDMLNKTSKEGIEEKPKARFRTKDIDIYNIYANEDNISDQIGIDEKAAEIKLLGLLQPLEVMYEPNQSGEEYKLIGEGSSPAETFNFTIENAGVTDAAESVNVDNMPTPTVGTVSYTKEDGATIGGNKKTVDVTLPAYKSVGVYTYTINEETGTTAGVDYDTVPVTMKVTVVNGEAEGTFKVNSVSFTKNENKLAKEEAAFNNTYSANKLSVKKVVTGNLGDKTKLFTVNVTLKNNTGKEIKEDISYLVDTETRTISASDWKNNEASVDIQLKHEQTITFTNLPFGVKYEVTEANYTTKENGGYDTPAYVFTKADKTVSADTQNVTITNNKGGNVDTGVNLTTLPYILVFAGVIVIAGAAFITRRRKFED